ALRVLALPKNATPLLFQYNLRIKRRYTRTWKKRKKKRRGSVRVNLPKNKRKLLKGNNKIIERKFFNQHLKASTPKKRWVGLFKWPIPNSRRRAKSFGRYRTYILGKNTIIRAYHRGIDISRPKGTPVKASNNGVIAVAAHYSIRGNAILINHGQGIYTAYYHLSRIHVKVGQSVKKGELIGRVGTTGLSTGPHLHWELRVNGVSVNPDQWCRYLFPYKFAIRLPRQARPIRQSSHNNNKKIVYHITKKYNANIFRSNRPENLRTIDQFE
ncbi:MAG TPA: M23 family metallopeptidase, partial [Spirochaetes bacterium]|nr:M23 family metallopeptidase [Spirochaetota bacterium]